MRNLNVKLVMSTSKLRQDPNSNWTLTSHTRYWISRVIRHACNTNDYLWIRASRLCWQPLQLRALLNPWCSPIKNHHRQQEVAGSEKSHYPCLNDSNQTIMQQCENSQPAQRSTWEQRATKKNLVTKTPSLVNANEHSQLQAKIDQLSSTIRTPHSRRSNRSSPSIGD